MNMKIIVKAKTRAKQNRVERVEQPALELDQNKNNTLAIYKVYVKEAPVNGKANEAIIEALSEYFDTAKSNIVLLSGASGKQKFFEIN